MADDINNLILNVTGRDEVESLKAAIEKEEEALRKLIAAHGAHDPAVRASAAATVALNDKLRDAEARVKQTGSAFQQTASATRGASQAAVEFSRGMEDLATGGFLGILNNIPRMFEGIAQSAGLSAAKVAGISTGISLAATGAYVLYRNWDQVMSLFGESTNKGIGKIKELQNRIKELEEKKAPVGIDIAELDEAKRKVKELEDGMKAYQAAKEGKTVFEKEAGKKAEKMFAEQGPDYAAAQAKMADIKAGELAGFDPKFRKAKAAEERANQIAVQIEADLAKPGLEGEQRTGLEISLGVQRARAKRAGEEMAVAIEGVHQTAEAAIGALQNAVEAGNKPGARGELAGRLRQVGAAGLAGRVEEITPEAAAEAHEFDRQAAETFREQTAAAKVKKKEAADAARVKKEAADFDRDAIETYQDHMRKKREGERQQTAKRIGKENVQEAGAIKASGAGLMAEQLMAATKAQGGAQDKFGRFHKMDDEQIFNYVQAQVQKYLHRQIGQDQFGRATFANRGMGREETSDLATRITAGSKTDLDKRLAATSGQNLSNTGKLLGIAAQLASEVERQMLAGQAQARAIDDLQRRTGQVGQTRLNVRNR